MPLASVPGVQARIGALPRRSGAATPRGIFGQKKPGVCVCVAGALALTGWLSGPVAAQDVVGTSVLKGRKIELLSDRTWRFSELDSAEGCVALHAAVDFCGRVVDWRPRSTSGSDFSGLFFHDDRHMAGLIIEELGARDGYSAEFMREAVLQFAADASEVRIAEIPVLGIEDSTLDGHPSEDIVYGAVINGLGLVYANRVTILDGMTIQAMSWAIGKELTPRHRELHENFTSNIRVSYEEETQ